MLKLSSETRKEIGQKLNSLREEGKLPAVVYGTDIESLPISVDYKEFEKVFKNAGETTLINLKVEGKEYPVLIHDIQTHPVTERFLHVDFYQASLKEKTEATVPLVFEGKSLAVEELEGTLVKSLMELEIKALPQNIPHEIKVDVGVLETFEDHILVKDLPIPEDVEVLKDEEEIVVSVVPPEEVEEELEKPFEEDVEDIEKVGEKEKEEAKEAEEAEEGEEEKKEESSEEES